MTNVKKLFINIFSSGEANKQLNISPIDTDTAKSSDHTNIQLQRFADAHRVQNSLLVWLDGHVDAVNDTICRNNIILLQRIFNSVNTFTDSKQCTDFLKNLIDEKAFMIISGTLGRCIVSKIHDLCQVDSIYIFCMNKTEHEQWANEWSKIKGVFTDILSICEALQQAARQCEQDAISISCVPTNGNLQNQTFDQHNQSFMYTQVLKEILLTISSKQTDFKEFIEYCQQLFIGKQSELEVIDKLKRKYHKKNAIRWYTRDCFLYKMLNQALLWMEIDTIFKMSFFVRDLHQQIERLHSKQFSTHRNVQSFSVYRGQRFSINYFQQMQIEKGGFLSFNNFLSTSKNRDVSLRFAQPTSDDRNAIGVLFVMIIDPSISSTPFASISDISRYRTENEILFSTHTVFRIGNINPTKEDARLLEIELTQISNNDHKLCALTKRIREETEGYTGWDRLGRFFIKLGLSDKAQQVYESLLETAFDDYEKANFYNQLGWTQDKQDEYEKAISYYKRVLAITERFYPDALTDLASAYSNISVVYNRMGDYSNALSFQEKALEIRQKIFHSSHPELAHSYNNLGLIYFKKGDLSNAQTFLEKAFEMRQKIFLQIILI